MPFLVLRKDIADTFTGSVDLSGAAISYSSTAGTTVADFVASPVVAGLPLTAFFMPFSSNSAAMEQVLAGAYDAAIFDGSEAYAEALGILEAQNPNLGVAGVFSLFVLEADGWQPTFPVEASDPTETPGAGPDDQPDDQGSSDANDVEPALIYDLGGKFDRAFNQSAYEGAERWADATGNSYGDFELLSDAQREAVLRRFAEDGFSPVVAIGFSQSGAVAEVAAEFPGTDFAIIDSIIDLANVGSYTFDVSEGAYVMGVIAATASQTGTIGFIGGMDTDLSRDYAEAYTQGATDTRAGINVLVNMTGATPEAWNDPVRGYELATAQMALSADIIFTPAGGTSIGVLQSIADFRGNDLFQNAYAIGNDYNLNYLHPGDVLTSLVKNIDVVVENVFANSIEAGTIELGFADGGWSYAVDENNADILTPAIRAAAEAAIASFEGDLGGGSPTAGPDLLNGTAADDALRGLDGHDTLNGGRGDDLIQGGNGNDTAVYSGDRTSYTIVLSADGTDITDRRSEGDGTDQLTGIESLSFVDGDWALDIFDNVADLGEQAFRDFIEVYIAYFNRAPDAEGLFFYGTAFANGTPLETSAATFLNSAEYQATYPPGLSNQEFAEAVYDNVLGRIPDLLGLNFWVGALDSGGVGRDTFILEVLKGAKAPAPENATQDFVDQKAADVAYLANKTDVGLYFSVIKGMSNVDNATTAMQLFDDGGQSDIDAAVAAIDGFYSDALDPVEGEFLLQLVGVVDDPFLV